MKEMRGNTEAQLAGINTGEDLWENAAKVTSISSVSSGDTDCTTKSK